MEQGQYLASPPILTSGALGVLQLDSSGRLIVNIGSGSIALSAAVAQGTAAALAGGWPVELTDGTNLLGTSAHPVATTAGLQLSATFAAGQQATTATAAKLNGGTSTAFTNGVQVKNLSTSSATLFLGGSGVTTTNGYELAVGESIPLPIADVSTLYQIAAGASTATACWIGCN
jgi:hypothetical protein